jgi:hypothetical protein
MSVALDHTCTLQLIIQRVGLVLLLDIGVTCYDDAWASAGHPVICVCRTTRTGSWRGRLTSAGTKLSALQVTCGMAIAA